MAGISSSVGLVSGLNTSDIINQLMTIEQKPVTLLQSRIDSVKSQQDAYGTISTQLTTLQSSTSSLRKQSFFEAATATSSAEDVLTATASTGAAVGSFQFQVARLVTSQQSISQGFSDFDKTPVGAGTLTIEEGGGDLSNETMLNDLNGGAGVRRGSFRIADRSGASATIDISSAVSLDDVVKKINTSLGVQVQAKVDGDKLVLTDASGKTTNDLIVSDVSGGHAAADLGIVSDSTTGTISGTDINFLSAKTSLSTINDGRGLRTASDTAQSDISIDDGGGAVSISLANVKSMSDVIKAINTAGGTRFSASTQPGSNALTLTASNGGTVTVANLNDSKAADDLGLTTGATQASGTMTGRSILAGIDTVMLSSLNGGTGLPLGTISVQSRAANSATNIDLSTAGSVKDILDDINNANAGVTASLNASGNGIQIVDTSNGTGTLHINDVSGTGAQSLGIKGDFDTATSVVKGANLQMQWFSQNTLLSSLNGGKGIAKGAFQITSTSGAAATIDLSDSSITRVGDLINAINSKQIGVTASINPHGDGLLLTDTAGKGGKLKVEEVDGTTAADLNIQSDGALGNTIDGSYEKTISISNTDTLSDVQTAINNLGFGVTANIINDGSGDSPYRLSLNVKNSGRAGRVVFDSGTTSLDTSNLVDAQDAAVFVGNPGSTTKPLLVTSSKNQLSGLVKGVTVDLHSTSDKPVTINVARDGKAASDEIQKFVDGFNTMIDNVTTLTQYDTDKQQGGVLLGENTVQTVQTEMYKALAAAVPAGGKYRTLADIGISIDDDAKLKFDSDKFNAAYADDPTSVEGLFTHQVTGLTSLTPTAQLNNASGIRHADSGPDMHIALRDGTGFDVTLGDNATFGDILTTISNASNGKLSAKLGENDNIILTDTTTGSGATRIQPSGTSQSVVDLGLNISAASSAGSIVGNRISFTDNSTKNVGAGVQLDNAISRLIAPVTGAIPHQNKELTDRTTQFQSQIDDLNKLLDQKKTRLENQFANLESVLAGLQTQQQSLGSLSSAAATAKAG